jgi:hypothetical protein
MRVAVKTSETHHDLGRLFLKSNAKISIDIPLDYLSCTADVILAMFFEKSLFLKRFSCSDFPDHFPHAELQSFS